MLSEIPATTVFSSRRRSNVAIAAIILALFVFDIIGVGVGVVVNVAVLVGVDERGNLIGRRRMEEGEGWRGQGWGAQPC